MKFSFNFCFLEQHFRVLLFNSLMSNILRLVMDILVTKLSLAKIMNAVY